MFSEEPSRMKIFLHHHFFFSFSYHFFFIDFFLFYIIFSPTKNIFHLIYIKNIIVLFRFSLKKKESK